ncbi:hypothetical protein [Methylocella sp.]|uniref:hypothetical protein n=1 Tax=Methylocella sp. TaxID=1978226 RepID=UPI003783D1FD
MIAKLVSSLAVLACLGAAAPASARPLTPAERQYMPYSPDVPACADRDVLSEIRTAFDAREREFWRTGLDISVFDEVREIGYRSNGLDYIPRRYCMALVTMNDGKRREVSYSIIQSMGTLGFGFGVDWCVSGLDRLDAQAPNCKMARP